MVVPRCMRPRRGERVCLPVDRPLRLAYVVKRFPRYSETFIVNEILAHEAAGCEVEVFSLRPCIDSHFQDVLARLRAPVRYVPSEGIRSAEFWSACTAAFGACGSLDTVFTDAIGDDGRDVYQALVLARWLRDDRFDHVHAHFASLPATVARIAAALAGITWTFTAHAKDIFHEQVRANDLERKCQDAAAVITVSDFNHAHLTEHFGSVARRIVRVYNGLELARVPYAGDGVRPIDVLAVGRLVEKKGFEVLIDACAELALTGRSLSCEIIGEGELEAALRARIARRGIGSVVRLSGPRPQGEVLAALRRAKVFAAPCLVGSDGNRDGLPTTILEAMASGTPCIATPVTGIPEVVRDGDTGVLVPSNAPRALADAIARLLDRQDDRDRLARAARALIEAEFDSRITARSLRGVFDECAHADPLEAMA
jgi:glycosyltransferase involved in cell wall biosynthesis